MRRAALLVSALALALASPAAADDDRAGGFWLDVTEPHHDEVASLMARCEAGLKVFDDADLSDTPPTASARRAAMQEIEGVLRYARKLEPDSADVLRMLARVADEAGDAREARGALHALVALVGEDHAGPDALDRIGTAAIEAGRFDDAIRVLRIAQGPVAISEPASAPVLVHLATALAFEGRTGDAIDVLANEVSNTGAFEPTDRMIVAFALAVQYDRDEQRGAAFDVLDRMKAALGDQLPSALQTSLARMRFAPAEDERYYRALMDEVVGDYPEARTEWLLYAADDGARYRRRALDHARALDALPPPRKVPTLVVPSPPIPQVTP